MAGTDVIHVTLDPTRTPAEGLVEKVAKILNKDVFAVRVILNGKIPKVAGHYPDLPTAESIAQDLRSLGYQVVMCRDSELRQRSRERFRAHTLQLGEREVSFRDKGVQTRTFEEGNLFLILRGTIKTRTGKVIGTTGNQVDASAKEQKVTRSINIPATLMTGIPVIKTTKEKAKVESVQYGEFLWLYDRASLEPVVEILQSSFDYSSLGDKKALSSSQNLNIIMTELKNIFPQAILDSRLTEHFRADVPFATLDDEVEINSRLIYLHHRAASGPGAPA
jgi:hypothetical protein